MIHEILPVGPLRCNCSIIGDETAHEAMVIDPGDNIDGLLERVRHHGLTVKMIVITHGHIDHIGGAAKLKAATGAPIYMNAADQSQIATVQHQLRRVNHAALQSVGDLPLSFAEACLREAIGPTELIPVIDMKGNRDKVAPQTRIV